MTFDNWAVVWSDSAEIKKITDASASQLKNLKDRILAGEVSLKLPLIEYTTGHDEAKLPLDFERETTLINSLEPLNGAQFLDELHSRNPFRPFVAMLEGKFLLPYNATNMFKSRWEFLKRSHLVGEESSQKIDSILQLPDWEIEALFERDDEPLAVFDRTLIQEAKQRNDGAEQMVTRQLLKDKPVNTFRYGANNYLLIAFDKPGQSFAIQEPAILFPESSRESIPDASEFYGRICGIVNYIANPPPIFGNVILQSVILALPIRHR